MISILPFEFPTWKSKQEICLLLWPLGTQDPILCLSVFDSLWQLTHIWTSWKDGFVGNSQSQLQSGTQGRDLCRQPVSAAHRSCMCWLPALCRAHASSLFPITVSTDSSHNTSSPLNPSCLSLSYMNCCLGRAARICGVINQWIPPSSHKKSVWWSNWRLSR